MTSLGGNMKQIFCVVALLGLILILPVPGQAQPQRINSLNPANPFQGGSFEIVCSGFPEQQGAWVVVAYPFGVRQALSYQLPPLRWGSNRIMVEVPADMPSGDYSLMVRVPNRLLGSNSVRLVVRARAANRPPPSLAAWISRAHVTVMHELWIYGQHFHEVLGGMNRRVPQGARVAFSGNGVNVDLEVIIWNDSLVKTWLPVGCEPGVYQVTIFRGAGPADASNHMSVTVRPEMVGHEHPGDVAGFMHIASVQPVVIPRGTTFTILGDHFDVYRREAHDFLHRIGQGRRVVELVDVHHRHARAHACNIYSTNPAQDPDYLDQGNRQWFNDHIVAVAPAELDTGSYLLRILDREDNRSSNNVVVRVVKNAREAQYIETISPRPVLPGGELILNGRNFGDEQGDQVVIVDHRLPAVTILEWVHNKIRIRLPGQLTPGRHSVRVYDDSTLTEGSNLYSIDVAANNP